MQVLAQKALMGSSGAFKDGMRGLHDNLPSNEELLEMLVQLKDVAPDVSKAPSQRSSTHMVTHNYKQSPLRNRYGFMPVLCSTVPCDSWLGSQSD